jgi:hypothetical protein
MYSKLASCGMAIYLAAIAWAFAYPHFDHSTFAGVFFVLLALPWVDYFPGYLLPLAVALNALIIYVVLAVLSCVPALFRRRR